MEQSEMSEARSQTDSTPKTDNGQQNSTSSSQTSSIKDNVQRDETSVRKRLTLTFRNINVRVTAAEAALGNTILSEVDPRQLLNHFHKSQRPKRVRILYIRVF
jgi:hypothetical protein